MSAGAGHTFVREDEKGKYNSFRFHNIALDEIAGMTVPELAEKHGLKPSSVRAMRRNPRYVREREELVAKFAEPRARSAYDQIEDALPTLMEKTIEEAKQSTQENPQAFTQRKFVLEWWRDLHEEWRRKNPGGSHGPQLGDGTVPLTEAVNELLSEGAELVLRKRRDDAIDVTPFDPETSPHIIEAEASTDDDDG